MNFYQLGDFENYSSFLKTEMGSIFRTFSCGHNHHENGKACDRELGWYDYQLIYMISGTGNFTIDGIHHAVSCGDIILIPPNVPHKYSYDYSPDFECYWVHFDGDVVAQLFKSLKLTKHVMQVGIHNSLINIMSHILKEFSSILPFNQYMCATYTLQALYMVARYNSPPTEVPTAMVARATRMMNVSYNLNLPIKTYADECGVSVNHFLRVFKKATGVSPVEYVNALRIENARSLISTTKYPIKTISEMVGIHDQYYFSRLFKKLVGSSPSEFRNRNE